MYTKKLKLGLLLDSFNAPAWVNDVIQRIVNNDSCDFALVVLNEKAGKTNKKNINTCVYSIFNQIDERIFAKRPDPFISKNIKEILIDVPYIKVHPQKKGNAWILSDKDATIIRDYQLDILLKFGFEDLRCDSLDVSKYGTWFYYHGDDRVKRGGPPGFWEVVENWPETSSAIIAEGGEFSPYRILFRSQLITYPLSPARHRSYYFWATTTFLSRQIELLQKIGKDKYWEQTEIFQTTSFSEIRTYQAPSNVQAIIPIGKIISKLIKEFIQRLLYIDQWFLLFSLTQHTFDNFSEFIEMRPSKGKFWADPHVIRANGSYFIFIEEFICTKRKGHISVIELDDLGNWKAPIKVLEKDYHLSYPFIFEWENKYYMVPESRANKTIDLYECVEFPYKWNFKQCLMDNISAVDTTLFHYRNKWWLFSAIAENEAAAPNVELFLYFTDNLFSGDWKAHPQNPIISDVKSARPAGDLFIKDGKLYRPSQDCSKTYGYGFDLNEVVILSETEYSERKTISIRPIWDKKIHGTHTYANCNNLTIIDAYSHSLKS